ncbi:MAG: hypothetical protein WBM07_04195 [Chitinivibrionales bacterium]|jgi:hypothetical protein
MPKKFQKEIKRRKLIRKEKRVAARLTDELYNAIQDRAYRENKTGSIIMVEALMQYLDFKMPPLQQK